MVNHLAIAGGPQTRKNESSSYDGEFRMPLVLAQGSAIFHSSFEEKLETALE